MDYMFFGAVFIIRIHRIGLKYFEKKKTCSEEVQMFLYFVRRVCAQEVYNVCEYERRMDLSQIEWDGMKLRIGWKNIRANIK